MDKSLYRDMWVYIEHDGAEPAQVGLELLCRVRKLCDETGERLCAVIIGALPEPGIQRVKDCGADRLILVDGRGCGQFNIDVYANVFTVLSRKYSPSAIFVGGSIDGRDFAPRFAVQLGTGCTSDAMELRYDRASGDIEFIEPAVGGKIMAVITVPVMRPQVGTVRPGTFKYAPAGAREDVEELRERIDFPAERLRCSVVGFTPEEADPELDIAGCQTLVCVGNGLKSKEGLERYRELARLLGGKVCCTRPLFDRGILPYKLQVGQSGVIVKPRLYIGFGVSGAVNHVAGVEAEVFVAVNTDPQAQIFAYADYGVVGDMDQVCDAMLAALRAGRDK